MSPDRQPRPDYPSDPEGHPPIYDDAMLSPDDLTRLDAELEASEFAREARAELAQLLAPPADLVLRTAAKLNERLLNRETAMTMLDLLGLGIRTTKVILNPNTDGPP